jgi:hypothetical protein
VGASWDSGEEVGVTEKSEFLSRRVTLTTEFDNGQNMRLEQSAGFVQSIHSFSARISGRNDTRMAL